jgi:O-antigen ligase
MTVALIILIYTTIRNYKDTFRKIFLAALALPILVAMVSTGSRGAVVAFIAGAFVYLMPYYKTTKGAISAAVLAVTCVVAVVYIIADNAELVARWQEAYYDRNFSERENIFGATMEMVSERPIFGWGPIAATYQLGFLGGGWDPMDTHNLFLYLLAEVGLVGIIPFLVGLYYCFRSAWKARHGNMGLLPLALLVTTLFGNLSGNNLLWKPQWLVLALATASGSTLSRKLSRPLARVQ